MNNFEKALYLVKKHPVNTVGDGDGDAALTRLRASKCHSHIFSLIEFGKVVPPISSVQ